MTDLLNIYAAPRSADTFRNVAQLRDLNAVEALVRTTGVFNPGEIAIARELVEECLEKGPLKCGYHFLFADSGERLEGFVCFGPLPGTEARFELYWIAVDPAARGRGLGRRLQFAAEAESRRLGAQYLIAETSTTSAYAPARSFYRALGYEHLGDIPYWHSDNDGLAVFGKRL